MIFGVILQAGRGLPNYVAFVIIGVFMFQFTSSSLSGGVDSIRSARALIRAFTFPRASIVISLVTRNFLQRVPAVVVMFIMIAAIPPHAPPTPTWLLFPVVLVLHTVFNLGIALFVARLGHSWPDFSQATSFIVRILMYGSAVIFPIERFVNRFPTILTIVELNPVYAFLSAYRSLLIDGVVPGPMLWVQLVAWAAGALVVGFLWFWSNEESYASAQ